MDARSSYREAAGRGASGVRLVIMLYEQIIQDLGRAIKAIEQGSIELRTREINHALTVVGHLQATLDVNVPGAVVANLARFYASVRARMTEAHLHISAEILREQIKYLLELREAWEKVDQDVNHTASSGQGTLHGPSTGGVGAVSSADWKG